MLDHPISVNRSVRILIEECAYKIDNGIYSFLSRHSTPFSYAGGPVDEDHLYEKLRKLSDNEKLSESEKLSNNRDIVKLDEILKQKRPRAPLSEEHAKFLRQLFVSERKVATKARQSLRDEGRARIEKLDVLSAYCNAELAALVGDFCRAAKRRLNSDRLHEIGSELENEYQLAFDALNRCCWDQGNSEDKQIEDAKFAASLLDKDVHQAAQLSPLQLRTLFEDGIRNGRVYFDYPRRVMEFLARLNASTMSEDKKSVLRWLLHNAHENPQPRESVPIPSNSAESKSKYLRRLNENFAEKLGYKVDTKPKNKVQLLLLDDPGHLAESVSD